MIPFSPERDTLTSVLSRSYQQVPDEPAVYLLHSLNPDRPLTYRQLIHGAAGYADALRKSGIQPGEVTIVILNHGEDLLYAFFGAALAGAIPSIMPFLTEKLSPDQYRESLASLFDITRPAAAITYHEFAEEVHRARGTGATPRQILISEAVTPIDSLNADDLPGLYVNPASIALLQHSSGTTGLQKGIALSHQAVFDQLNSYSQAIELVDQDVIVSWLPLYHDMGLIAGFLMPILCRVPLVLMSPFDWVRAPVKLIQAVSRYKGTLCWLPNFAYNFSAMKVRDRDLAGIDLSSWRAVINCSEPMHWNSHRMFLERFQPYGLKPSALATSYAMAENVFAVTQGGIGSPVTIDDVDPLIMSTRQVAEPPKDSGSAVKMVSAGKSIANTRMRVVDANGQDLPERHIGQIAIQSSCMLTGYYNRADLTQKAFLDGWFLTGDLGYLADGELYITGRKKDLIIVGGKNIYPQDLERIASTVPGVHPGRVVAFGVFNDQIGTEDVVIVAEVDSTDSAVRMKIADELRMQVTRGSDIALRHAHIVDRGWLLKTSSGKIARSANRDKYLRERS